MVTVSPARKAGCCDGESEFNPVEDFPEHGDLLDIIDFDDLFGVPGDVLPDLEILAGEFSDHRNNKGIPGKGEEVVSKRDDEETVVAETVNCDRKRKYSKNNLRISNNKGKRKVDWTPELHRRFVEVVEQLGVEKAVPSRILELMGVHCLTRHNVASHLQKYRSHRKHLQAREAEAANWTRKRHIYGLDNSGCNVNGRTKNGWFAPTIGFPPMAVAPPPHRFRPLHVWGHPTADMSVMPYVWPKHLPPPSTAMATPPFWPTIHNGTSLYLPTVATRFRAPPITPYKPDNGFRGAPVDLHPSKESVDAAIGDVLTRPWLPLPLGLKPPAVEGVMTELHRHGVSEVPPTASCA